MGNLGIFMRSALAGIAISVGGTVYLRLGGVEGAVLFTFGLLTVVHYQWDLYTGKAGFWPLPIPANLSYLAKVLLGNALGCLAAGLAVQHALPALPAQALQIVESRLALDPLSLTLLGTGCGFLMTTAVTFARDGRYLPLLFAVPTFIMCGFAHSIADAFYYCAALGAGAASPGWAAAWLWVVLGNFIGCNLYLIAAPLSRPAAKGR
ncbi:MAG: formate/nitrite transporter family protein [Succinivibrionaceae bacterium]|nr:formate/nitrite transporter family protein [Succinivibrionaceae bacterium]